MHDCLNYKKDISQPYWLLCFKNDKIHHARSSLSLTKIKSAKFTQKYINNPQNNMGFVLSLKSES